jgi:hypothetical protein
MKHRAIAASTAALLGLAALAISAGPAQASAQSVAGITTTTVAANSAAPAGNDGEAEATCAPGTLLVSGGYAVNSPADNWIVYSNAPINGNTWLVEVINFDQNQPLSFTSYAVCATSVAGKKGITGYTTHTVFSSVDAPANQTAEADATCAAGQILTGGGYSVENVSENWSIYLDAPTGTGTWTAEIDNEVPLTTTYDSFAVCLAKTNGKPVTKLATSTASAQVDAPGNGTVGVAQATCGKKQLMIGGGFVVDSIGQAYRTVETEPVAGVDWQTGLRNDDGVDRDTDAVVSCLSKA